jgi:hypothetical protein
MTLSLAARTRWLSRSANSFDSISFFSNLKIVPILKVKCRELGGYSANSRRVDALLRWACEFTDVGNRVRAQLLGKVGDLH